MDSVRISKEFTKFTKRAQTRAAVEKMVLGHVSDYEEPPRTLRAKEAEQILVLCTDHAHRNMPTVHYRAISAVLNECMRRGLPGLAGRVANSEKGFLNDIIAEMLDNGDDGWEAFLVGVLNLTSERLDVMGNRALYFNSGEVLEVLLRLGLVINDGLYLRSYTRDMSVECLKTVVKSGFVPTGGYRFSVSEDDPRYVRLLGEEDAHLKIRVLMDAGACDFNSVVIKTHIAESPEVDLSVFIRATRALGPEAEPLARPGFFRRLVMTKDPVVGLIASRKHRSIRKIPNCIFRMIRKHLY